MAFVNLVRGRLESAGTQCTGHDVRSDVLHRRRSISDLLTAYRYGLPGAQARNSAMASSCNAHNQEAEGWGIATGQANSLNEHFIASSVYALVPVLLVTCTHMVTLKHIHARRTDIH